MKAHELARQLLAGPDLEVVAGFDDAPEFVCDIWLVGPQKGHPEGDKEAEPVDVVTLHYGSGSTNYDIISEA